jgi:O-antigen/teichoic acid export membrane protein
MGDLSADLRRILSSSGIYAAAALAQQGASFLLLPLYTRFVPPAQYGQLELLNACSSIAFACLMLGLPSAVVKCYHRDCAGAADRAALLPTALALELPVLLAGTVAIVAFAEPLAAHLLGAPAAVPWVRIVAATGLLSSLAAVLLAGFRAEERALAFSVLTVSQLVAALGLNVLLVVRYRLGAEGILWGNLAANAVALALALAAAGRSGAPRFERRLAAPLLRFGTLLLPVLAAAWVMDLSDRYLLRLFGSLSQVAVYAVGYKIGMVLQLAVVWPFQLAWPAMSFAISHREGHRETYGRALTYLTALLAYGIVGLSLLARVAVPRLVGPGYGAAYQVVPLVAFAYACNGVHYCVSPGVHLAGRTRWFPPLALLAAAVNVLLNLLLIPAHGMMGAAWATAAAFLLLALGTALLAQRVYPVPYEPGRLAGALLAGAAVLWLGTRLPPGGPPRAVALQVALALLGLPLLLSIGGFLHPGERAAIGRMLRWPLRRRAARRELPAALRAD